MYQPKNKKNLCQEKNQEKLWTHVYICLIIFPYSAKEKTVAQISRLCSGS